jgi:hypothetical protein
MRWAPNPCLEAAMCGQTNSTFSVFFDISAFGKSRFNIRTGRPNRITMFAILKKKKSKKKIFQNKLFGSCWKRNKKLPRNNLCQRVLPNRRRRCRIYLHKANPTYDFWAYSYNSSIVVCRLERFKSRTILFCSWSQAYDRELQRQCCKNLQRHELACAFENKCIFFYLKTL